MSISFFCSTEIPSGEWTSGVSISGLCASERT